MSEVSQETMMFKREPEKLNVAETIKEVYAALEKKGYNPVDQLAGYLLSGDPTYITSFEDARTKLRRHERYGLQQDFHGLSRCFLCYFDFAGCGYRNGLRRGNALLGTFKCCTTLIFTGYTTHCVLPFGGFPRR